MNKEPGYYTLIVADFDENNEDILPRREHVSYGWNSDARKSHAVVFQGSWPLDDKAKTGPLESLGRGSNQQQVDDNIQEFGSVKHMPSDKNPRECAPRGRWRGHLRC